MTRSFLTLSPAGVIALIGACSDSSTDPDPSPAPPTVAEVAITPRPASLTVGQTIQLTATPTTSTGTPITGKVATWHVSNSAVASVSPSGMLTGVTAGAVSVDATIDGHADTIAVAITPVPVASIAITPGGDTLAPGQAVTLVARTYDAGGTELVGRPITFASSNTAAATVSPSGVVTAVAQGQATITASSGGASAGAQLLVPSCSPSLLVGVNSWSVPVRFGGIVASGNLAAAGKYKTKEVLYGAGLVIGPSGAETKTGHEPASTTNDFAAAPVCELVGTVPSHTYSKLAVSSDLRVTQETFAYTAAGSGENILFRYSINNTSATTLSAVAAGYVADWDLHFDNQPGDDVARRSAGTFAGEALEPDSTTYPQVMAFVSISPTGTFGYEGWTGATAPTRADYYSYLSNGTPSAATVRGDIRSLTGRGGVSIAPGAHVTLYFALVGGDTRAAFNSNVAAAIAQANALGYP